MPAVIDTPPEPVVVVRDLQADEEYVMMAFERHAKHCSHCADPIRTYDEGRSLCERGHQYALDVAEYLYSKNGKAYSVVDRDLNQATLVKIPRTCIAHRRLSVAVEKGLRLHRNDRLQTPVISYDQTYDIPARQPVQLPEPYHEIIEREPRAERRRRVIVYPPPRSSPSRGSRGSLYEADAADRVERYHGSSRLYRPTEYFR